jgi:hypothetical protein
MSHTRGHSSTRRFVGVVLVGLLGAACGGGSSHSGPSAADQQACRAWQSALAAQTQDQTDAEGIQQYSALMHAAQQSMAKADDSALRAAAGNTADPLSLLRVSAACRRAGIDPSGATGP